MPELSRVRMISEEPPPWNIDGPPPSRLPLLASTPSPMSKPPPSYSSSQLTLPGMHLLAGNALSRKHRPMTGQSNPEEASGAGVAKGARPPHPSPAPGRPPRPFFPLSPPLPSSFLPLLLSSILLLAPPWACTPLLALAQQSSPLHGQGVDPRTANATQGPTPLYLSIVLRKVASINEVSYRFEVVLDVYLSWRDPRVDRVSQLALSASTEAAASWNKASSACNNAASPEERAACQLALQNWFAKNKSIPECKRLCVSSGPTLCCDGVWLPDLDLPTNLGYSQDRYVQESIVLLHEPQSVIRVVRVQGEFSNTFDFHRFPFDSQVLSLPFSSQASPGAYFLEPSFVGRHTPGFLVEAQAQAQGQARGAGVASPLWGAARGLHWARPRSTEEITGWAIVGLSLDCTPADDVISNLNESLVQWQEAHQNDPIFRRSPQGSGTLRTFRLVQEVEEAQAKEREEKSPQGNTVCTLRIHVKRLSSYYVWMDIVPVVLTTVVAFSVLVTAPTAIDVRLTVVVTLFLALVAVQFIIVNQLPKTSYITTFGAMVITSYVVFFSLILEAVAVYYFSCIRVFHLWKTRQSEREMDEDAWGSLRAIDTLHIERAHSAVIRRSSTTASLCKTCSHGSTGGAATGLPLHAAGPLHEGAHGDGERRHRHSEPAELTAAESETETSEVPAKPPKPTLHKRIIKFFGNFKYISSFYTRLAHDQVEGYRVANWIDWIFGPGLAIGYFIAMTVLFAT